MSKYIKDEFDVIFANVSFDKKLLAAIDKFHIDFINFNNEHIEFFGGKLMGTHVVRFTNNHLKSFYELFNVTELEIEAAIMKIPSIDKNRIVTSDPFNITCMYIAHRFITSDDLNNKERIHGATTTCIILNYRFLTGIMNRFFQYPIDTQMAQALYANLTYKFLIKKLKNWEDVIEYRAVSMVHENQLHHDTIKNFNNDEDILKAIADAQGRIKDMMKNIYKEFIKVHKTGQRIYLNNDTMFDEEGIEILRDRTLGLNNYIEYILDVTKDTNTLIKNELIEIISSLMENISEEVLVNCLTWMSNQGFTANEELVDDFIKTNIIFSFDYINNNKTILHNTKDLGLFLSTLRGAYMSSRSTDPNLLKLRDLGSKIVKLALKISNNAVISNMRTSLLLYINLRTYTKSFYSN